MKRRRQLILIKPGVAKEFLDSRNILRKILEKEVPTPKEPNEVEYASLHLINYTRSALNIKFKINKHMNEL